MAGLRLALPKTSLQMLFPSRILALPFLVLLCPISHFAQTPQSQPPTSAIRVQVDQVNVGVIVTDARGHFVENLGRENFRVFDSGIEQPITGFSSIDGPAQVLLLVESGPAVYLLESSHLAAVSTLLNGLSADDRVAMAAYADAPQPVLDFTADKRSAIANLAQLHFNLGFSRLNLSSSLAAILDRLAPLQGKKTIVLLSTGVDTSAPEVITSFFARLKIADIRIFALSLSGPLRASQPRARHKEKNPVAAPPDPMFAEADQELFALAESTGGRAYFPLSSAEFKNACAEIAQLVRHEYSLSFVPPAHDATIHSIDVRVITTPPSPSTPANPSAPSSSNAPPPTYRIDHRPAYLAPE
jgi:Ca-activated chloride channel family protein